MVKILLLQFKGSMNSPRVMELSLIEEMSEDSCGRSLMFDSNKPHGLPEKDSSYSRSVFTSTAGRFLGGDDAPTLWQAFDLQAPKFDVGAAGIFRMRKLQSNGSVP